METLAAIPIVVFFLVLVTTLVGILGGRTTKLFLKKLVARESPTDEITPVIELVGRQQGIIPFLLTLFGLSPITNFKVTRSEVCFNTTSLFGHRNQTIPLRNVCSMAAGAQKPVDYLLFAAFFH